MSNVPRTGLFSRNFASTLVNRNKALSTSNPLSNTVPSTGSNFPANNNNQAHANENTQPNQRESPLPSSKLDSPASLNASFIKDQDGFDDVDAFFNQAVTPQKTPTAKPASQRATPARTPLKANGLVAKPVAIISSKIAAHYRKEPRFAVSMSEVMAMDAESEAVQQQEEETVNGNTITINDQENLVESAMETVTFGTEAFAPTDSQFQFDHDNDHDHGYDEYLHEHPQPSQPEGSHHDDDALVDQMVQEMLVDTDHHESESLAAPTKPSSTTKVSKAKTPTQPKAPRQRRQPAYFSGAEFDENGVRRSRRQRMSPLRYWANEKVCYGRAEDPSITLPVIVNVIKKPELDDPTFLAGKSKRTRQVNPNSLRLRAQAFGPHVEAEGYVRVIDEDGQEGEEERLLALSHHNVEGDPVKGNNFRIHTMFTEGSYMSAGQLLFPPGAGKPAKNSARHALVFYVIAGSFEVVVHETKFLIGPGGQFHVPRNNAYSITHVSTDRAVEGRLFFCHCKDNRE